MLGRLFRSVVQGLVLKPRLHRLISDAKTLHFIAHLYLSVANLSRRTYFRCDVLRSYWQPVSTARNF